ncbi:MAG: hypothetical protein SPF56_08500 [Bacteroidaceae bacterium]|nr:hypothetical protein [Bacteroidaceae bacterium]
MEADKGFIKISRKLFDNWIWKTARAFSECEAWIDLIQSARFEASPRTESIGGYQVTWGRGQYPASRRFLAKRWGRSEQWVKTLLGKLKRHGMIEVENTQGISVIRIIRYNEYNGTGNPQSNPQSNPHGNPLNQQEINELMDFLSHMATHIATHSATHSGKNHPTAHPNTKKEKNNIDFSNEKSLSLPTREGDSDRNFIRFTDWLKRRCPYIAENLTLPAEKEFKKLKEDYGTQAMMDVCEQIENRVDMRKRYSNLYRTMLNWLKRDIYSKNSGTYGTVNSTDYQHARKQRISDAEDIINRLAAQEGNDDIPIRG